MKAAMATLALLALVAGALQIPGVDDAVTRFLEPTFADSKLVHTQVPTSPAWVGLLIGALIAVVGIAIAYRLWVVAPGTPIALRARLAPVHRFLINKWYFDELIDFVVVRPAAWLGRFADTVLERIVIGGTITGGRQRCRPGRLGRGAALADRLPAALRRGDHRRRVRDLPLLPDRGDVSR